jgi:hypothetical protein
MENTMIALGPVYAIALALVTWIVVYYLGQQIQSKNGKITLRIVGYVVLLYALWSFYVSFMMEG